MRRSGVSIEDLGPVRFTAKGPFTQPNITVVGMAGSVMVQGANLRDITLEVQTGFEQGFSGMKNTVVELKTREVHLPQAPVLRGRLRWPFRPKATISRCGG